MKSSIRIVSYNMLKGKSFVRKKNIIPKVAELVSELEPDILVLQEAPDSMIEVSKHPFSALLPHHFLGMNAKTKLGEHGNAIFSRFEILEPTNKDVSRVRFARRGVLSCKIKPPTFSESINIYCTHLDLFQKARDEQVEYIFDLIDSTGNENQPLILCGDFNDWNKRLDFKIQSKIFGHKDPSRSKLINTYPAIRPILPLDRIYLRNLELLAMGVPKQVGWKKLSDHLPLVADFVEGV